MSSLLATAEKLCSEDKKTNKKQKEMLLPYAIIILLTSISASLSTFMIIYILSSSRRYTQYYHMLCLFLGVCDIVQSLSWWIAMKYQTTLTICSLQEYLLQGSSLLKATITVIISTVTLTLIRTKQKLNKKQFFLYCILWFIIPLICVPLSIYYHTASTYCRPYPNDDDDKKHNQRMIAYSFTILLPLIGFIVINIIIFLIIRSHLLQTMTIKSIPSSPTHTHTPPPPYPYPTDPTPPSHPSQITSQIIANTYDLKLLHLTMKLNSYPIMFSFCWSIEILAVFIQIIFNYRNAILDYIGIFLISLTGTSITCLYILYEWNSIQVFLGNCKEYIYQLLFAHEPISSEIPLTSNYTSSNMHPIDNNNEQALNYERKTSSIESFNNKIKVSPSFNERNTWNRSSLLGGIFTSSPAVTPSPITNHPLLDIDLVEE